MRAYAVIDSTNSTAMTWAAQDAPHGSLVIAEQQTAGRGRQGRSWQAASGQNLLFSIVLRPSLPVSRLNLITLAASVAVSDALSSLGHPLHPTIKWPNDILLESKKCCGMLLESSLAGRGKATVVLGVGLNVNQLVFPAEINETATSLALQAGRPILRAPLLAHLLARLEYWIESLTRDEGGSVRQVYAERLHAVGEQVTLRFAGRTETVSGIVHGINDMGALRLLTDEGPRLFHSGEVTTQAL